MGGCSSRLRAELEAPPQRSQQKCQGLGPRRPSPHSSSRHDPTSKDTNQREYEAGREVQRTRAKQMYGEDGAPLRRETQSGIPGLTYDQCGRPV
jgi:hypothetical protein